jgi:hypothetical protein
MCLNLMRFQIHLRVEDRKLFLQTLSIRTQEMVFFEVHFEGIVVDKVLLFASAISAIANVAAFVLVSTVCV